ncbi:hypothetical protein NL676_027930, partial [Syzygium grande]
RTRRPARCRGVASTRVRGRRSGYEHSRVSSFPHSPDTLRFVLQKVSEVVGIGLTMADEEPVDQKKYFEDSCKPKCVKPLLEYEACVKRIQGDESGHKHCTGQYFDYWFCVDKCVAPKLFPKLNASAPPRSLRRQALPPASSAVSAAAARTGGVSSRLPIFCFVGTYLSN